MSDDTDNPVQRGGGIYGAASFWRPQQILNRPSPGALGRDALMTGLRELGDAQATRALNHPSPGNPGRGALMTGLRGLGHAQEPLALSRLSPGTPGRDALTTELRRLTRNPFTQLEDRSHELSLMNSLSEALGSTAFRLKDLRKLCAELKVDFNNLPKGAKKAKAHALVVMFHEAGELRSLHAYVKKAWPKLRL